MNLQEWWITDIELKQADDGGEYHHVHHVYDQAISAIYDKATGLAAKIIGPEQEWGSDVTAFNCAINDNLDMLASMGECGYNEDIFELLENCGVERDLLNMLFGNRIDPRDYAILNWDWIIVHDKTVGFKSLNDRTVRRVRDGILDIVFELGLDESEIDDMEFWLEVRSTGRRFCVAFSDLREGCVSALPKMPLRIEEAIGKVC